MSIRINADVLRWALDDSNVRQAEFASKCGFDIHLVESWLNGESQPNTTQLRTLAKRLGRSIQFFMLPQPPESHTADVRFRRSMHNDTPEPEKEAGALRSAQRAQALVQWVEDGSADRSDLLVTHVQETPARYAARLQQHLGWTIADQRRATSKSAVFKALRLRIEQQGVLVLLQSAGKKGFRGFSLQQDPPLIYVNKDYSGAALRTFTLLHELAHLGRGTGGKTCYYDSDADERWCNQVATEFLLPRQDFLAYVERKGVSFVSSSDTSIIEAASRYFKASWYAIAIRLTEFGLAEQELVEFIRQNYDVERDPSTPIPGIDRSTPVLRAEEFGTAYIQSVRKAVFDSRLSELEAGRLLRANARQLSSLWQLTSGAG